MRIAPIAIHNMSNNRNKIAFEGYFSDYSGSDTHSAYRHIKDASLAHKYSVIRETHNDYVTNRIYVADPEEGVFDSIKQNCDFVIYDARPLYPSLSNLDKLYKNNSLKINSLKDSDNDVIKHFEENLKEIYEYYGRLLNADYRELSKLRKDQIRYSVDFEKSRYYKDRYDSNLTQVIILLSSPDNAKFFKKQKDLADHHFNENKQKLQDVEEKIPYYEKRIEHSQKMIDQVNGVNSNFIESISLFAKREKLRTDYHQVKAEYEALPYIDPKTSEIIEKIEKEIKEKKEDLEYNNRFTNITQNIVKNIEYSKKNKSDSYDIFSSSDNDNLERLNEDHQKYLKEAQILENEIHILKTDLYRIKDAYVKRTKLEDKLHQLESDFNNTIKLIKEHYNKMYNFYYYTKEHWQ